MSFYTLKVPNTLAGFIRGLHPQIKKKVKGSLKMILDDPEMGKALKDELDGLRSFRVGRFRIVYRMAEPREIQIIAIGPRDRIYEETYRIIAREAKRSKSDWPRTHTDRHRRWKIKTRNFQGGYLFCPCRSVWVCG